MASRSFCFLLVLSFISFPSLRAQPVSKTVIAEHFTNTYCSVCAFNNPPLYNNLNNHPQVLHIAYHPSSPYAACPLSMHNVPENNARTNFYGIFGATPRLIVQGNLVSGGFANPAIYTSVLGQTTSFSMSATLMPLGADSFVTRVVIKKEDTSSLTNLQLYGALVEDTLFFTAANGETRSYDVFRRALWGSTSLSITAPVAVGDSVVFTQQTAVNTVWLRSRMYAIVMLQDAGKEMIQAARSSNAPSTTAATLMEAGKSVTAYPNPATDRVLLKGVDTVFPIKYSLYEVTGRQIQNAVLEQKQSYIDLSALPAGIYHLMLDNGVSTKIQKR